MRSIKLNDAFVDFSKQDMNKLMKDEYDANWRSIIVKLKTVSSLNEIPPNSPESFKILYEYTSRMNSNIETTILIVDLYTMLDHYGL